jgi:hypothetical protein
MEKPKTALRVSPLMGALALLGLYALLMIGSVKLWFSSQPSSSQPIVESLEPARVYLKDGRILECRALEYFEQRYTCLEDKSVPITFQGTDLLAREGIN